MIVGSALFRTASAFLELGMVNAWRSFGSVVFWPDAAGLSRMDSFDRAVAAHPRFLVPTSLPLAVEFGFEGVLPHWYGHPVSVQSGAGYSISLKAARRLLAEGPEP